MGSTNALKKKGLRRSLLGVKSPQSCSTNALKKKGLRLGQGKAKLTFGSTNALKKKGLRHLPSRDQQVPSSSTNALKKKGLRQNLLILQVQLGVPPMP